MEQRVVGRSGLAVPVVAMGTWRTFDVKSSTDVQQRRRVVDVALECRVNLFDSSPMYGEAERVLGNALDGRRDQAMIATKVWTADDRQATQQIRDSFRYFGGRVEIYQVHNLVAWRTRLQTLESWRDQGKVSSIGITHYQHSAFPDMMQIMRTGRVSCIQIPYNALDREVEREVLPLAADLGIGVLVMRPLGQGTLAAKSPPPDALKPLAEFGVRTWAQALLKWVLSDPRITAALPATSNTDHARDNAAAGDPPWFGPEQRAYIQRLAAEL